MFATAARILLSAIFLLLAVIVSPFIFQEPEPELAPAWSLRVLQTPDHVYVGDTVAVEIVLLRNGLPGQITNAAPSLTVLDEQGAAQDETNPVLVVRSPVRGENTARTQRWVAAYTAVRPGPVRIHAVVDGAPSLDEPMQQSVRAEGMSEVIAVQTPQLSSTRPTSLTSLYFGGIVGLCLLSAYLYRRQMAQQA